MLREVTTNLRALIENASSLEEADMAVANTIIKQMGGMGKLKAMIGANTFVGSDKGVTFRWPSKKPSTGNAVRVTLDADDTYSVEFMQIGKGGAKTVKKMEGIYADQLIEIFEKQTGLYLSLGKMKGESVAATLEAILARLERGH